VGSVGALNVSPFTLVTSRAQANPFSFPFCLSSRARYIYLFIRYTQMPVHCTRAMWPSVDARATSSDVGAFEQIWIVFIKSRAHVQYNFLEHLLEQYRLQTLEQFNRMYSTEIARAKQGNCSSKRREMLEKIAEQKTNTGNARAN
jgi:hypothetical protein